MIIFCHGQHNGKSHNDVVVQQNCPNGTMLTCFMYTSFKSSTKKNLEI